MPTVLDNRERRPRPNQSLQPTAPLRYAFVVDLSSRPRTVRGQTADAFPSVRFPRGVTDGRQWAIGYARSFTQRESNSFSACSRRDSVAKTLLRNNWEAVEHEDTNPKHRCSSIRLAPSQKGHKGRHN